MFTYHMDIESFKNELISIRDALDTTKPLTDEEAADLAERIANL